ncbi:AraC family transcriptional regulator [Sphingobacteriaceae bacterium]|nr:AraC family transcriptional regulator [Sphingobacteriaceae bacterium]
MFSERYSPCPALQPFIKTMMIIESSEGMQNKLLPDTSIVIAFRLRGTVSSVDIKGKTTLPTSLITGLRKSSRLVNYEKNTAVLLVIFKETGLSTFLKTPAHEFFGESISLEQLFPKEQLHALEDQLADSHSNLESFQLSERFFLKFLSSKKQDYLIVNAVQTIKLSKGSLPVKILVNTFPISHDAFEKRFRKTTGTSPKHFSSIVRFRHLISNYTANVTLTDLAYDSGFFDQNHFIKNFKSFTGETPRIFFQAGRFW